MVINYTCLIICSQYYITWWFLWVMTKGRYAHFIPMYLLYVCYEHDNHTMGRGYHYILTMTKYSKAWSKIKIKHIKYSYLTALKWYITIICRLIKSNIANANLFIIYSKHRDNNDCISLQITTFLINIQYYFSQNARSNPKSLCFHNTFMVKVIYSLWKKIFIF